MAKYKIRFTKDAQVEKAREDGRGGFKVEKIPVGTEMVVKASSLTFWQARGCVELIETVPDVVLTEPVLEKKGGPFGIDAPQPMTKKRLAGILDEIETALKEGDGEKVIVKLREISGEDLDDPLADLDADNRQIIDGAVADATSLGDLSVHPQELVEAIDWAKNSLLPPSRRKKRE